MCVCVCVCVWHLHVYVYDREKEEDRDSLYPRITLHVCLSHSINDNESCADLLLERMDNVSINSADKSGR